MNKKTALLFAPLLGVVLHSTVFASDFGEWKFSPYLGVDAQVRRMDFKGGYGDNLLRHNSPQGNGYVGLKLKDYFALEAGYESTVTRSRLATLTTGDVAAGTPIIAAFSPVVFRSKIKIKGPHINVAGFYSFYEGCPMQLFATVGMAFLKGTAERQTISVVNKPRNMIRTLSGHKAVLRLVGGLQYMFSEHFGIRSALGWSETNKLIIASNDNMASQYLPEIKPKGTTVYSLGFLWIF